MSTLTEARVRANKKWNENNKERVKYLSNRSRTRSFVKNSATSEDLDELEMLIAERRKALELLDILEENEEEE